jgi:hypothetical protein
MEINKNEIKQTTVSGDNKVSKVEEKKSIYNLKLEMSVTDAEIVYVKAKNDLGYEEETEIEQGVNLYYVNAEKNENGEDEIIQKNVYIDFKWDMVQKRGEDLLKDLIGNDVKLLDIIVSNDESFFPKRYEKISKSDELYFNFNRSLEINIISVLDISETPYNKKKIIKTEIAGIKDKRKRPIEIINISKGQAEILKGKKVLIENIKREYKKNSKRPIYSTTKLPKVI